MQRPQYYYITCMRRVLFLLLILVVTFRKYIWWIALLVGAPTAQAQEETHLDDQPRDTYNPTTTVFTTQKNIQYNHGGYQAVADNMNICGVHRFTFIQQYGNKFQNLGNNGTAINPIFYVMPQKIGATSGFHAYDIYFRNPNQFRYYDTKSPYSKLYVILARFGSSFADICHSRNVTPTWNIGMNFRTMMTDKEWIPRGRNDRNVISYGLDLFTHYKTTNEQYQLLAHVLIAKHRVRETGGIFTLKYCESTERRFEHTLWEKEMQHRLKYSVPKEHPTSSDARKRFHLYHQCTLAEQLEAYHELSIEKKKYQFRVDPSESLYKWNAIVLGESQNDQQEVIAATTTSLWDAHNELGVKGHRQDWFYSGYYRHKKIEFRPQEKENNQDLHEHYVGLQTRLQLVDDTDFLYMGGEYLVPGFYKMNAAYQGTGLDVSLEHIKHKPAFLAQHYDGYGHRRKWDNQFAPPTATHISGGFKFTSGGIQLKPHISFTSVKHYIYFSNPNKNKFNQRWITLAEPIQTKENINMLTLGTDLSLPFGAHIRWDSEFTTAKTLGPSARFFSIPTFLINSRLYYTDTTAAGNGTFETGIDMHWKSSYKADGYDPVTQQFYHQNVFAVYSYPVIDLFLNFRIKNFGAFLKFSHCNEGWLAPAPGYFVTPLYPGQKKAFDIGLSWAFFD